MYLLIYLSDLVVIKTYVYKFIELYRKLNIKGHSLKPCELKVLNVEHLSCLNVLFVTLVPFLLINNLVQSEIVFVLSLK